MHPTSLFDAMKTDPQRALDRRVAPRFPTCVPVRVNMDIGWHQAVTCDVSRSGLAIQASREFYAGQILELTLQVPDRKPIKATAEVVHDGNRNGTIGMRFINIEDPAAYARYICERGIETIYREQSYRN